MDETGLRYEVRPLVGGTDPANEVIDVAAETEAALIVIGIRRRTADRQADHGSSQRILLEADCPVLAVKPDPVSA